MMSWPRKTKSMIGVKFRPKNSKKSSSGWNRQTQADIDKEIRENNQRFAKRAKE